MSGFGWPAELQGHTLVMYFLAHTAKPSEMEVWSLAAHPPWGGQVMSDEAKQKKRERRTKTQLQIKVTEEAAETQGRWFVQWYQWTAGSCNKFSDAGGKC